MLKLIDTPNITAHVVCDLDGTLLNSKGEIHPNDIRMLEKLGKAGVCRTIATGRSLYSFNEVIEDDFPIDYLIVCAGGAVIDFKTKELLYSKHIPADEVKRIAGYLHKHGVDYQVREPIPNDHVYHYERFFDNNPDFDRLNRHYSQFVKPIKSINELGDASRIISIAPGMDYIEFFETCFSNYSIIRATSPTDHRSVWMELYPRGVNKGKALTFVANHARISLSETIGLGNDYNDIHFLDIVQSAFVTDNAPEALKRQYKPAANNDSAPLCDIMERIGIKP